MLEPRKNCPGNLRPGHGFLPVSQRLVARPKAHALFSVDTFGPEENDRVPALEPADLVSPKDLHEVTWFCGRKIGEISPQLSFVKKARGPGAVRIPAAPNALTIGLSANEQGMNNPGIEPEDARGHEFINNA